jgi:hypothetical protein
LENILSPINLEKNCQVHYDLALKLCSGLGSKTEIHSGEYGMDYWTYRIYMNGANMTAQFKGSVPQLADFEKQLEMLANEFPLRIAGGSAERNENGQIVAHVSFSGATKNNLAGMKLLGVDEMTFATDEKFLSTDPSSPSVFESTADFKMDQGTMMPQLLGGMMALEADVDGDFFVSARIHKDGDHLLGEYVALTNYRFGAASVSMELDYIGKFTLRLMN